MSNSDAGFSEEQEGRIALLLRRFASARTDEEKREITVELRDLTGEEIEGGLSRWLKWYLDDHLGMRNAVAILNGQEVLDEDASPAPQGGALRDEQVFMRPEYNWCAVERIKNRDDMMKLRELYSDLESPVPVDAEGPFSFGRLTGLSPEEREYFRGKSVSEALFGDDLELFHLRVLKDYGKMMMMPVFPSATQRAGAIIYASAIAQAMVRFDQKITSLSYKEFGESIPGLLDRPYIVEPYAKVFQGALERCR